MIQISGTVETIIYKNEETDTALRRREQPQEVQRKNHEMEL